MSGVNRNILLNTSQPVGGTNSPTDTNLITTSGSRWVIMDFLNTAPTSSNGLCNSIVLEWSPDPSMATNPYQPSSSYYAVTSSVLSCQSASLQPVTGSEAWLQYIDAYFRKSEEAFNPNLPSKYYLRAYQNRVTSPIAIYSPAFSVETNANVTCGSPFTGSENVPTTSSFIFADMNAYQSSSAASYWYNDRTATPLQSASFLGGTTVINVKAGGPNYDGLRIDGAGSVKWPQVTIQSADPVSSGVGIVRGRVKWIATSAGLDFEIDVKADSVPTTSSITITRVDTGVVVGKINSLTIPTNLQNTYVEIILDKSNVPNSSKIKVDGTLVGEFNLGAAGASGSITLKNNFEVTSIGQGSGYLPTTSILRCVTAQTSYKPDVFHCKYGPVGASSYVQ